MTEPGAVKQIPYGIADYRLIRDENYYFIDKTRYIAELERAGRFLFFIRPRRFGKTMLLSMLRAYYDIGRENQFDYLFGDTWIHGHPTPDRGKYLVLDLNFSLADVPSDRVEKEFNTYIHGKILGFFDEYPDLLEASRSSKHEYRRLVENPDASSVFSLSLLIRALTVAKRDMYVLIDEYDNFANTILTERGSGAYTALTHGEGFLRGFFKVLKAGAGGFEAPIKRLFITGVSPITMDDVTSGFNIGKQISLDPQFNAMLGFTRRDVEELLDYYTAVGALKLDHAELMNLMDQWYGNYRFAQNAETLLYNTDMILYMMDHCLRKGEIPINLVDRNVRIDYGKLRNLIVIDGGPGNKPAANGNFGKLKQIIENGETTTEIVDGFPMNEMAGPVNFYSQLFYFGLLTIRGTHEDKPVLGIPNQTIRRLFYDYIESAYRETGVLAFNVDHYLQKMGAMAYRGDWRGFLDFITGHLAESLALRDLITGEKSIQAFLNVYLGLSEYYIVHAEKELNRGYADLFLEPFFVRYPLMSFAYVLEIKYLPAGENPGEAKLAPLVRTAEEQLRRYSLDVKMQKALGKAELIKLVLIFSGSRAVYIGAL